MIRSCFAMVLATGFVTGGGGCEGCSDCGTEYTIQQSPKDDELDCTGCDSGCAPEDCPDPECPTPEECPPVDCSDCPDPECPTPEPTEDDSDLDNYILISLPFSTVMVAPAGTTQANAWVQVQCPDNVDLLECSDQEVVLRSVHVWSVQAGEFEPAQDFCPGTDLAQDVQWSVEDHLRGVNNNVEGGALFYGPNDGVFTVHPDCGLQFRVPSGWYAAPMSCNIHESCDSRTAEAGAQYYWDVEVCRLPHPRYPWHNVDFRLGMDWLACRGSQCADGNDDWLDEVHTPWISLPNRTCVHVSPAP